MEEHKHIISIHENDNNASELHSEFDFIKSTILIYMLFVYSTQWFRNYILLP